MRFAYLIESESYKQFKTTVWRSFWDVCFAAASVGVTFIFGLIVGNLFLGLPVGADTEFRDSFALAFRPYAVLVGFFAISAAAMHGSRCKLANSAIRALSGNCPFRIPSRFCGIC
jgi:cytochrome bd-type quinol oxidase subunit 2